MLVGDGLTQVRFKTLVDVIQKNCCNMSDKNITANMMSEALKQIACVPSYLHGALLHFLNATYSLFFTCLARPMQKMIGWKYLKGKDVSKCYQQAAGLLSMINIEL